ncbi:hypothetical protein DFH08DRAFT_816233 [Mycena albidolilacea]|uniref:Uncharacterized protein n=1 Tax=Mycena albidolilacea TaxID=1033008 RepID=A0AAD6ZLE5_9AGAR|nr:hypothetical protein DFH08DRAFT_816233 [Mycena albidolilacea]
MTSVLLKVLYKALERYKKKHSVIKLTPRDELERKKAKPLTKVLEVLDVEQSWSVDQIDTSQAAQGCGRCRGLLLLQATFRVLEALEVKQEQAGQIYWSAFDGDGIQVLQEGGRHREHPLFQATLVSEVLEAEQGQVGWLHNGMHWSVYQIAASQAVQEGRTCRGTHVEGHI